ncbi:MAG: protein translocase subunit SecF [Planctomycetaceae bacterium]|nr:protein translocase subunit SecF [Planctomycetaceae bacterium]
MSMFTAIYASRGLFAIAAGMKMISENSWCLKQGWLNRINVHFMSKTKLRIAAVISLIIITSGLVLTVNRKSEMLAIDLSGGTSAIFTMDDQTAAGIEQEIKANGFELEGGQELQLNITSVDLGDDSDDAWRVNTNIEDQNELASLLKDVFGDKLPTQSLSVTVVVNSADAAVEDSSAVERIMPQFVAYQEEEPATEETTETKEPATDEEAAAEKPETVEEASTETEKPATAETEEATVTGPKAPEQNDSTTGNSNDEFNTQDNQENAVEVNSVTLKLELVVGGTEVNLKPSEVEGMIDAAVTTAGVERKTTVGEEGGRVTVYDIDDEELRKLTDELAKSDGTPYFEETQKFGAQIAGDMTSLGTMAIVFSFVGIITYIWLRFQHVSFGIAAVVALVHDVLVTLAAIALSKYFSGFLLLEDFKISLPVIAAFLTIIGYSLNDTIVVFDRVREVRGKNREITAEMLNKSVNSTLSRTLLTSLTTLFVVTTLYIGGGSGIHSFAFALVIGVVVGTYSSIFVASPTLLWLNNRSK